MVEYDFEFWVSLATQDPDTFESLRKQFIEHEINNYNSSTSNRLFGLQFQIDMECERSASAMGACLRLSGMMMDCFYGKLQPKLNELIHNERFEADKDNKKIENNIANLFKND